MSDFLKGLFQRGSRARRSLPVKTTDAPDVYLYSNIHTASEFDSLLRKKGREFLQVYRDVYEDAHARALLYKRKNGVTSQKWVIEPQGDSELDKRAAAVLTTWFSGFQPHKFMSDLLEAVNYGIAVNELAWDRTTDGLYLPSEWQSIYPEDIRVDGDGNIRVATKKARTAGILLDEELRVVHRFEDGNGAYPYGRGLAHNLYPLSRLKREDVISWIKGIQKTGSPILTAMYSNGVDPQPLLNAMKAARSSGALALPEKSEPKLLGGDVNNRGDSMRAFFDAVNEEMTRLTFGETLTSRISSQGSNAATRTHNDIRREVIQKDAVELADSINVLLAIITRANWRQIKPPRLRIIVTDNSGVELEKIKVLRELGMRPVNEERVVSEIVGYDVEYAEVDDDNNTPPAALSQAKMLQRANILIDEAQDARLDLARLSSSFADDAISEQDGAKFAQEALEAVKQTNNAEEALEALRQLSQKPRKETRWVETLENALFAAELVGSEDAQNA